MQGRGNRSQAAIDFMTSYGFALLIIAIAVYAVLQLGVFNYSASPSYCYAQSPFSCTTSGTSINTSGVIAILISQFSGGVMTITGMACSTTPNTIASTTPNTVGSGPKYGNVDVLPFNTVGSSFYPAAQSSRSVMTMYPGVTNVIYVNCYSGGSGAASGSIGSTFTGYVWINYTFSGLPSSQHYISRAFSINSKYTSGTYTTTVGPSSTSTSTTSATSTSSTSVTSTSSTSTSTSTSTVTSTILYYYVPINVINTNSVASTPTGFQQMISFTPSTYSSYYNGFTDLGNIRFYYGTNELYSWCESGCTTSSSTAVFWVVLPSSLGTSSPSNTIQLQMQIYQAGNTEYDGAYAGEAPQLSGTYGQYDNGAHLFTIYGGGGSGAWGALTDLEGTWTSASGPLQQTATTSGYTDGPAALAESASYAATGNYIIETYFNTSPTSGSTYPRVGLAAVQSGATDSAGYRFILTQSSGTAGALTLLNDKLAWVTQGSTSTTQGTKYKLNITDANGRWYGWLFSSTGSLVATFAPTNYVANNYASSATGYVGVSASSSGGTAANPVTFWWFRMRDFPPGDVMPTVQFGSVSHP